jgi:hypothetical protein
MSSWAPKVISAIVFIVAIVCAILVSLAFAKIPSTETDETLVASRKNFMYATVVLWITFVLILISTGLSFFAKSRNAEIGAKVLNVLAFILMFIGGCMALVGIKGIETGDATYGAAKTSGMAAGVIALLVGLFGFFFVIGKFLYEKTRKAGQESLAAYAMPGIGGAAAGPVMGGMGGGFPDMFGGSSNAPFSYGGISIDPETIQRFLAMYRNR